MGRAWERTRSQFTPAEACVPPDDGPHAFGGENRGHGADQGGDARRSWPIRRDEAGSRSRSYQRDYGQRRAGGAVTIYLPNYLQYYILNSVLYLSTYVGTNVFLSKFVPSLYCSLYGVRANVTRY